MKVNHPKDGDTRIKSGFLLFPKTMSEETRWLEHATWMERYYDGGWGWISIRWLNELA